MNKNYTVIGIDHGYGNIKTAHTCFKTGITCYDTEPTFKSNMLEYGGKFYIIGDGHKEFIPKKQNDNDYYVLTLTAIGRELYYRKLTSAKVFIAAGLPLTWVSEQKDSFREYLLQNTEVQFTFKGIDFNIKIVGADIFPQGFSAVAERLYEFSGVNMLCDISNGTMNVMYTTTQTVDFYNPSENQCYFVISLYLSDGTMIYKSDYIKPGERITKIELLQILKRGIYKNCTLNYDCFTLTNKSQLNGSTIKLEISSQ